MSNVEQSRDVRFEGAFRLSRRKTAQFAADSIDETQFDDTRGYVITRQNCRDKLDGLDANDDRLSIRLY